jgi:hypothetical protein
MRHRFTFALYDDIAMDAELLDYIIGHDKYKRGDVIRMLLRVGYSSLVKHNDINDALIGSVDPESIRVIVNALAKTGAIESANKIIAEKDKSKEKGSGKLIPPIENRNYHKAAERRKQRVKIKKELSPVELDGQKPIQPVDPKTYEENNNTAREKEVTLPEVTQRNSVPYDDDDDIVEVNPALIESEFDDDEITDPMKKLGRLF